MIQQIWKYLTDKMKSFFEAFQKGDLIFFVVLILLFMICNYPLNYYITIGGGISDVASRVKVDDGYSHDGSFNISYVSQLDANVLTYGLSYLIPSWEREDANRYKYSSSENMDDIQFRSDLDLKTINGNAIYWAYTTAQKEVQLSSEKLYVIALFSDTSGLEIQDEIISADGKKFSSSSDLRNYIQGKEVGESISFHIIRKKKEMDVESLIFEQDDTKMIGVGFQFVKEYTTNPNVSIQFKKSETGPSGGLITALEIYNQLTKKDITKGKVIAGTGTIEDDGSVGEIGGIEHKILGAEKANAEIFLCPGGSNYEVASKYIKDKKLDIQLIQVDTFMDAIMKLEELK